MRTKKKEVHFEMCCILGLSEQKEKEIKMETVGFLHLTLCVFVILAECLQCVSEQSTRIARAERGKGFFWSSRYPRNGWRKGKNGCKHILISLLIEILFLHLRFSSTDCCHPFWLMQWMICLEYTRHFCSPVIWNAWGYNNVFKICYTRALKNI